MVTRREVEKNTTLKLAGKDGEEYYVDTGREGRKNTTLILAGKEGRILP